MYARLRFTLNRIGERLWVKPLLTCLLSLSWVYLAGRADMYPLPAFMPQVTFESLETLLEILSASMLVIATLAVTTMVSAYASATNTATPRAFALVVADDKSQNALSTFVGTFIFSIVALVVLQNGYYQASGRLTLLLLTLLVFAYVVVTFVRWVDSIARLGRMQTTIAQAEQATVNALQARLSKPNLGGVAEHSDCSRGLLLTDSRVGFIQLVDMARLQSCSEKLDVRTSLLAGPGDFILPQQPLLAVYGCAELNASQQAQLTAAVVIGNNRTFDDDPGFGLQVLSEIASRALSPALNDPGTALDVLGVYARVFQAYMQEPDKPSEVEFDRVAVPELSLNNLLSAAFDSLIRDGAANFEVGERLQRTLQSLALLDDSSMWLMHQYACRAWKSAEREINDAYELERLRNAARWALVDKA